MKMKELSALTGISDRTIRYYIDDGLFIPEKYTENYEGRRSYDFSKNDVKRLNYIALLRKYGFPISEIKELKDGSGDLVGFVDRRIAEAKQSSEEQLDEIRTLEAVAAKQPNDVDGLCELLSNPVVEQEPIPSIDEQSAYKPMYEKLKKRFTIALSVIVVLFSLIGVLYIVSVVQKIYRLHGIETVKLDYEVLEQLTPEQADSIEDRYFYSTWDGYFHNDVYEEYYGREYKRFPVNDYTPYRIRITVHNNSNAVIGASRLVGVYSEVCVLSFDNDEDDAWMSEEIKPNESKTVEKIIWFNNSITDEERQRIIDNLDFMYEYEIDIGFMNSYEPYYFCAGTKA